MKVAIVEDHQSVRDALASFIRNTPGYELAATWGDAESAIRDVAQRPVDIVLMDINLPGQSGIECVRELKRQQPSLQFIMLTIEEDSQRVFESLAAGACGYLVKNTEPRRILEAIREVAEGGSPMSSHIARMVVQRFHQQGQSNKHEENLTDREQEILQFIAKGYRAKEIAKHLGISVFTVQTHVRHIYEKLHVRTRAQAVAKYLN